MNTGVQRVVREVFRNLAALTPVTPVLWDPGLASYCTLSARERKFLETPFGRDGRSRGEAEPGRRANRVPFWSKFVRRVVHWRHRFDLAARATPSDTLFVPEIFQDNRLDWLEARAREKSLRLVGVCHDAIAWRRPDITPPERQAGFGRYLDVLGGFDQIMCVSKEVLIDLEMYWREKDGPHAPLTLAGWPVNHAGAPRPSTPPPGDEAPSILCVATFEPRKNHLVLLAAADLLWQQGRRFELVLIGRTTAHWGSRVRTALDALQAAGRPVRWLRHVDDRTLNAAYSACKFTVFPSLLEGFGLPILESLWHGRPCVCGRNGALGEVAGEGGCLLVDQTDAGALADGMDWLLADSELYARLQGEAQHRLFDDWERYAARLLLALSPKDRS
jgi:glycosyltransferase involved in cell wall biosynthesis